MGSPGASHRACGGDRTLSRLADNWDNDDVRIRPSKRSRPRSKIRPQHSDAVQGLVTTVDRGRYTCLVGGDAAGAVSRKAAKRAEREPQRVVTAMRARELGRRAIAVGDRVDLVGDTSGDADSLARIVRVVERTSELRRSADDTEASDAAEKVLVANADQLVIVTAVADPVPRTGFIDRCLVAAYAGNLQPVLLLTKADLADPTDLLAAYAELELPVLVSRQQFAGPADPARRPLATDGVDAARDLLRGKMSVLIGHSGVGKSTLVNALVPDADRATGSVTGVGKGRHTSTSAIALRLPEGGWVIDTPGVRSFGLAHVTPDDLLVAFDDLVGATADCPSNCEHLGPPCALDAFVADGGATSGRLESFRRLLHSRAGRD